MRKEIKKYKGYFVSDDGKVFKGDNELEKFINSCGYEAVKIKGNIRTVAYLVANAFVPNDDKCWIVGFKDFNQLNSNADNLFWYYQGEEEKEEGKERNEKKMLKCDMDGNIITEYKSGKEAATENNMNYSLLSTTCYRKGMFISDGMVFIYTSDYYEYTIKYKIQRYLYQMGNKTIGYHTRKGNKRAGYHTRKMYELHPNGEIKKEYESLVEITEQYNLKYDIVLKSIRRKKYYLYDNNIIIYASDYDNMNDILEHISKKKSTEKEKKLLPKSNKRILQINNDGDVVEVFKGIQQAADKYKLIYQTIYLRIKKYGYYDNDGMILVPESNWNDKEIRKEITDNVNR